MTFYRIPLKAVLGDVDNVAALINVNEQSQLNRYRGFHFSIAFLASGRSYQSPALVSRAKETVCNL